MRRTRSITGTFCAWPSRSGAPRPHRRRGAASAAAARARLQNAVTAESARLRALTPGALGRRLPSVVLRWGRERNQKVTTIAAVEEIQPVHQFGRNTGRQAELAGPDWQSFLQLAA